MLAAAAAESWLKAHVTCHGNLWLLVKYQKAKYRFQLERCWNDKNYQYYHYSLSRDLVGRLCYVKYIKQDGQVGTLQTHHGSWLWLAAWA